MKTEIDNDVTIIDDRFDVVAGVDFPGDLQIRKTLGAIDQSLPHAPLGARDDYARHIT
jgi:hypothetical protein